MLDILSYKDYLGEGRDNPREEPSCLPALPPVDEPLIPLTTPLTDALDDSLTLQDSDDLPPSIEQENVQYPRNLRYAIAASIALHILIFGWLITSFKLKSDQNLLKPDETLTRVRILEQPMTERLDEPAPEHANAISDRNHSTVVERIPKVIPNPRGPIGQIDTQQQKLAAIMPPTAPEVKAPQKDKTKKENRNKKELDSQKNVATSRLDAGNSPLRQKPQRQNKTMEPDLNPTQREMEIATGAPPYSSSSDFFPDGDADEAIVDINTREEKFFSYLLYLKNKIQGVWVYPSSAANAGIGGSLIVEFSIARSGELLSVTLIDSSGHPILDESAIRAIKVAAPYYPFPERMRAKRLRIRANFVYITGNYFRRIL